MTEKLATSDSPRAKSINSIPIEFNVKIEQTTCCSLCRIDLFISCILYLSDICFECFLILQWMNNEYYIAVITLCIFIFLANLCNLCQWYSFNNYTTFKLCHLIILFGLIGLLPWFAIIYYLCHSSCCARIGIFNKDYYTSNDHELTVDSNSIVYHSLLSNKNNLKQRRKLVPRSKSHNIDNNNNNNNNNNNKSELLLPASSISSFGRHSKMDIYHELLSNITQIFVLQAFMRIVPSICIELFILITSKLDATNWFLTGLNDTNLTKMNIPNKLHSLLIENDLNSYHFVSILLALITYSFITVIYLDLIENWQQHYFSVLMNKFLQFLQILFVISDLIIRTMPLILILTCNINIFFIIFGLEILWCLEVIFWYEIYEYFTDFPMRKIYPFTYQQLHGDDILPSDSMLSPPSHIPMRENLNTTTTDYNYHQNETNSRLSVSMDSNHSSPKQYKNPRYITSNLSNNGATANLNAIVLSPASESDHDDDNITDSNMTEESIINNKINNNKPKVWVTNTALIPKWGLVYDEYIAFLYGIFGGTLTCLSGWLIARSIRHCVANRQYKLCIFELIIRYIFSIILIIIYMNQYHDKIYKFTSINNKYWIWIIIFIGCLLFVMPYITVSYLIFKPKVRRQRVIRMLDKN